MNRPDTYPAIVEAEESPKGLGRDGNKPLMRNRCGNAPAPRYGILPDTLSLAAARRAQTGKLRFVGVSATATPGCAVISRETVSPVIAL